jgi:hypothetical protein
MSDFESQIALLVKELDDKLTAFESGNAPTSSLEETRIEIDKMKHSLQSFKTISSTAREYYIPETNLNSSSSRHTKPPSPSPRYRQIHDSCKSHYATFRDRILNLKQRVNDDDAALLSCPKRVVSAIRILKYYSYQWKKNQLKQVSSIEYDFHRVYQVLPPRQRPDPVFVSHK